MKHVFENSEYLNGAMMLLQRLKDIDVSISTKWVCTIDKDKEGNVVYRVPKSRSNSKVFSDAFIRCISHSKHNLECYLIDDAEIAWKGFKYDNKGKLIYVDMVFIDSKGNIISD